jgi:hypothetical protein
MANGYSIMPGALGYVALGLGPHRASDELLERFNRKVRLSISRTSARNSWERMEMSGLSNLAASMMPTISVETTALLTSCWMASSRHGFDAGHCSREPIFSATSQPAGRGPHWRRPEPEERPGSVLRRRSGPDRDRQARKFEFCWSSTRLSGSSSGPLVRPLRLPARA